MPTFSYRVLKGGSAPYRRVEAPNLILAKRTASNLAALENGLLIEQTLKEVVAPPRRACSPAFIEDHQLDMS